MELYSCAYLVCEVHKYAFHVMGIVCQGITLRPVNEVPRLITSSACMHLSPILSTQSTVASSRVDACCLCMVGAFFLFPTLFFGGVWYDGTTEYNDGTSFYGVSKTRDLRRRNEPRVRAAGRVSARAP